MSGLKKTGENLTYVSLSSGMLTVRVSEPTETSVSRVITKGKNEGKTVHEEKYNQISGTIKSLDYEGKNVPFQKEPFEVINLIIEDDERDLYKIEFPLSSTYAKSFVTRLPQIDFSKPITMGTHWIEGEDGKERGYISIKQDGEKLEAYYSKDDMPPIVPITNTKGAVVAYDDEDLMTFYKQVIDSVTGSVADAGAKAAKKAKSAPVPQEEVEEDMYSEKLDDDDLPF